MMDFTKVEEILADKNEIRRTLKLYAKIYKIRMNDLQLGINNALAPDDDLLITMKNVYGINKNPNAFQEAFDKNKLILKEMEQCIDEITKAEEKGSILLEEKVI